jgi:outer membrane protein
MVYRLKKLLLSLFLFLICFFNLKAQNQTTSLKELLQLAEVNYPLLKSKAFDIQAAQQNIEASKKTIIPSLDASYQLNYATYNNITGMAYPQFLIPISGPPSPGNDMTGAFGSAASLLLNWQPLTFGQRRSQIDFAKAGLQYAKADEQNEIFKHKVNVINAYLDALMAIEFVRLYEENVKRIESSAAQAKTLVITGIKPGVDSSLLKAEVSKAKIDLLNGNKFRDQSLIILSELLATDNLPVLNDTFYFNKLPSVNQIDDSLRNPLLSLYSSSIELSNARKKVLAKTKMPAVAAWGTTYARGSGISYDGTVKSTDGLGLQRYNYGLGLQLSVPILQFARIKPQLQQQDFIIKSAQEKSNEISLQLKKQNELADKTLSNAIKIVKETPLFLQSAAFSYRALLSRYQSGLANYSDLIQSQYGLIKAETDGRSAYIAAWKALLYKASVLGDLNIFLNQVN